jgi:hypothetical protein
MTACDDEIGLRTTKQQPTNKQRRGGAGSGGGSATARGRRQLGGSSAVAAARKRDIRVPPLSLHRSYGDDHRGRQQGQRRDGLSNDRNFKGADRNNNNQPLERAEGEAVAIKR